jgi:hypothetical protein
MLSATVNITKRAKGPGTAPRAKIAAVARIALKTAAPVAFASKGY